MKLTSTAKTYQQYLAERKPITKHVMPPSASPKVTVGDSHRHRAIRDIDIHKFMKAIK